MRSEVQVLLDPPLHPAGYCSMILCLVLNARQRRCPRAKCEVGRASPLCDIQERGLSSAGRAPDLHSGGQEFDPPRLHHVLRRTQFAKTLRGRVFSTTCQAAVLRGRRQSETPQFANMIIECILDALDRPVGRMRSSDRFLHRSERNISVSC